MRKSFTRLFKVFMLLCMLSLQVVAQGATFGISLSPRDGSCAASRTGDYVIDFNRNVYPNGLGVFALSNQFGTEYLTVQVPQTIPAGQNEFFSANGNMSVLFNADKVFIKLHDYTLSAETPYYITVSEDAIKDGSGTFFDGLEDHNAAALTSCINNVPDWDFTTIAAGPLDVKADADGFMFNPRDNAVNVNQNHGATGSPNVFTVTFNRPIYWKQTGAQGSALTAYPNGWLKDGYFALYTSTDGFNEEYGGNVVAHVLSSVSISGNVLSFTFSDYPNPGTPELLDPNTEYYLRVRPDIIVDYYYVNEGLQTIDHMWDGVNTNLEWNWKTKDGKAAVVAKAGWFDTSCTSDTASFWIIIDDDKTAMTTTSLKLGTSGTTINASNPEPTIKPFITINGSPIDAGSTVSFSVVADNYLVGGTSDGGANLLIRVKPKNITYATNTVYTVGLSSGMLDAGGDAILGKTFNLTSKDYTAPVSTTVTANADGTTFDILGRLNEPGTIYYIVVKRDDVTKDGDLDYWMPTANELYDAIGDPDYDASRGTSASDNKVDIPIYASGQIEIDDASLTYHERITGLPESHGTYYNVYYIAFDNVCSGHNPVSAATAHVDDNALTRFIDRSSYDYFPLKIEEATLDILPPYVSAWSADLLDPNTDKSPAPDAADGCSDDNDNNIEGIKRMGAIYVKMNESVELAVGYGNAITTGSQVEGIFLVEDNGVAVGLNAAQCSYDAATFTFKLVPDSAFKSGATVRVTLLANKIQDRADDPQFGPNGTEKLTPEYSEFCVENYVGPRAVCFDDDIDYWWTPTDGQTMVANDATILLAWDQQLFAPSEDESAPGVITTISNTPGSPTFVGRYIRIRSAATPGAAPTGAVVYQFDPNDPNANLDVFNFHFANNDEGAQITIELVNGNLFESETWYYVEIESGLQSVERIALDWDDADMVTAPNYSTCAPYNYYMVFQSRDNVSPTCLFYEDDDFDPTADLGLLEGTDIAVGSYILARISEWVQLGFDGFRDLSYTDTIIDANALRPYFTLKDPEGNPIQFDCKYFSLDRSTDEATVYIDPYNYPDAGDETPNWVACEEGLQVCFLGIEPAYEDDILEDDAANPVGAECDLFNIYCEPSEIPCLEFITLNGINVPSVPGKTGKDFLRDIGNLTRVDLLTLNFGFGGAMDTIPGQILELWSSTGLVATIASESGRDIGAASDIIRYQFDLTGNPGWIDNEDYFVRISGPSMTSTSSVWECNYPDPDIQAGVDTAVFFHTIDGTPPVITGFIPDDPSYGGCLVDKDVTDIIIDFNEPVAKGTGSMELRRVTPTGNTWIASINIASGTLSNGNRRLTFDTGKLYNGTTELCDLLQYDQSYFFHIPAGFVVSEGGPNAAVTEDDSLTFSVCSNPPPSIVCGQFKPLGDISDPLPEISIKFSEPVSAVANRKIQIYDITDPLNVPLVINFDVDRMHSRNGGMEYFITTEEVITGLTSFTEFEFGHCYAVNVDSAAFRDVNMTYTSYITSIPFPGRPETTCQWEFCYDDNTPPAITFWPETGEEHVAVNAHLYAYLDEEPWVYSGGTLWPLVIDGGGVGAAEVKQFFHIEVLSGTANCGGTVTGVLDPADWTLEFVGTDKQHLRFTVYDPEGHDFDNDGGTNNPTMQDEAVYRLRFANGPSGNWLCDQYLNNVVADTTDFTTEDICDPTVTVTTICSESPNSVNFTATMNEVGTIRWEVKNKKSGQTVTGSDDATVANGLTITKKVTGLNGYQGAYTYSVKVWATDNEVDAFETDAQIMAEWPWDGGADDFVGEEYDRIRDFLPAPNGETAGSGNDCILCDDDDPILLASYPKFDGTRGFVAEELYFPLNDSIRLKFNETILVNDMNLQGWSINLRDYENNIGVPLAYEIVNYVSGDSSHLILYPLDTAVVGTGITQQLIPVAEMTTGMRAPLDSERKYYLEIDRYAISDDDGCGTTVNYFPEEVGKRLWFKTTDETAPCLVEVDPEQNAVCVDKNYDITITFEENNTLLKNTGNADSLYLYIYRQSTHSVPHERVPLAQATITDNGDGTWDVLFPTSQQYRSNEVYVVRIPSGIFKDEFGNVWTDCNDLGYYGNGFTWSFMVEDYLPPVPSTTVHEHLSYLDVVLDDDEYGANIYSNLPAGTVLDESVSYDNPKQRIATSSYFKVEFDEVIYIKNTEKPTAAYKSLWDAYLTFVGSDSTKANTYLDDIYELLTITVNEIGSATTTTLQGPSYTAGGKWIGPRDYEIVGVDPGSQSIVVWIYNAEEHWTPLNTQVPYGLNSNSEYHVQLNGNIAYDYEDCEPVAHRSFETIPNFLTIVTRDDVPPTLTVYDGEDVVCTPECTGLTVGPCKTCVSAYGPLRLQFNTTVVQTPYVGVDYDSYTWASGTVNWWTEANLPLREDLLVQPNADNEFLRIWKLEGVSYATTAPYAITYGPRTSVPVTGMTIQNIDGKTTIDIDWANTNGSKPGDLWSEGYYMVEFLGGTVKDQDRIPDGNVFLGKTCVFKVEDTEGPVVEATYPANDLVTPVNSTVNALWIDYNQPIVKGAGQIEVRWMHGQQNIVIDIEDCVTVNAIGDTYDLDDPDNAANDDVLYIPFPAGEELMDFRTYYVIVPAGAVTDINACNVLPSAAINLDINGYYQWVFRTADATPPVALEYIPNNVRDEDGNLVSITNSVPRGSNLAIRFDENITIDPCNDRGLFIYHNDLLDGFELGDDFGNFVEFIPFDDPKITISGSDLYHGFDADVVTFDPDNLFENAGMYVIRVSGYEGIPGLGCGIRDFAPLGWDGVNDSITWTFTITNDKEPMLATIDPPYNHTTAPQVYQSFPADDRGWAMADELVMTFTEDGLPGGIPVPVAPNEGFIKIYEYIYTVVNGVGTWNQELWTAIDINAENVDFDFNKITVTDVKLRDDINGNEFYYVIVDPGAIINANPGSTAFFAGIGNAFIWRFQTDADDVFVPGFDILTPNLADDGVAAQNLTLEAASQLSVQFNEGIEAIVPPGGMVNILVEGATVPVHQIQVTPAMCSGTVLTMEIPAGVLVDETNYRVEVEEGAFGDTSTVSTPVWAFGGAGVWEFQTGDNTPPVATDMGPVEGCQLSTVELSLEFANESHGVTIGTGTVVLTDPLGTVVAQVDASAAVVSEDKSTVTMTVNGLPDSTVITVTVPAGFVFDGDPHSPLASEVPFVWNFTTGENTAPVIVSITPDAAETADTVVTIEFSEVVAPVAGGVVSVNGTAIDMTLLETADGGITWTFPVEGLASESTNEIVVAAGAFEDVNAGCTPNPTAEKAESITVGDYLPPIIISGMPQSAADYVGLVLNVTVSDIVSAATGNLVIYNAETDEVVETIAVSDFTARTEVNGTTLFTYTPEAVRYGLFYILIDAGAYVDASAVGAGVECPGIADEDVWPLAVIDNSFVDCYNIITPQRAQRNVPVNTTISIDFCNERIAPGTRADRFVTVGDQAVEQVEGENFFNYQVVESMINGNTLTIAVEGLKENTTYSIIIAPGAITDEAGNEFAGITDANKWIFTTGDNTAPAVTLTADAEINNETGVATITSTEVGKVYLAKDDVAPTAAALEAAISEGKAVGGNALAADAPVVVSAAGLVPGTYKAYAIDEAGNVGTAATTVNVVEIVPPPVLTIAEIQGQTDASPYAEQIVVTSGVVTAIDGNGYFMQDANAAWSGIYVFDRTNKDILNIGSAVQVQGTVTEYNGLTEMTDVTVSPALPMVVVAPLAVPASEAISEKYEGVLVKVIGRATASVSGTNDWTINTASSVAIIISQYIYGEYSSILDHNYQVIGVVYNRNTDYKVEPRIETDIQDISAMNDVSDLASSIRVYPNPFDKFITLNVSSNVVITKAVITNIAGQLVKEVINPNNTIPTSELRSGVYFISLHTVDGIAKTERIIKR